MSLVIALFFLSLMMILFSVDSSYLQANKQMVFEKQEYWRAWTTTFLHGDFNHLAQNAFFFTGLAMLLHHYFGFWVFPLLSFIVGGLINMAVLYFYPPSVTLVGVSGVIYFMASFWLTLYILIERRQPIFVRLLHALAVSVIFLFPEAFNPQTSYLAHGIGFLFGLPMGPIYYYFNQKKIRAKDVWTPIEKHEDWENIILLDESQYQTHQSEEVGPFPPSSDSARSRLH